MTTKKNLLAICGSTAANSSNLKLIHYIAQQFSDLFNTHISDSIAHLPHFNPDQTEDPPKAVTDFLQAIATADAVLICTPEYAMGVPGTLKNAIDWSVSTIVFSQKPTALITASSLGKQGHAALMETLHIIECNISEETELIISSIKTKINQEGLITDTATTSAIEKLMNALYSKCNN